MYRLRTSSAVEFMCAPSHLTKCPTGISRFGSPSDAASLFCPLLLPSESFSSWNRWSHSHSLFFFFFSYIQYYTQKWFLLLMASKSTSIQSQNSQVRRRLSKKKEGKNWPFNCVILDALRERLLYGFYNRPSDRAAFFFVRHERVRCIIFPPLSFSTPIASSSPSSLDLMDRIELCFLLLRCGNAIASAELPIFHKSILCVFHFDAFFFFARTYKTRLLHQLGALKVNTSTRTDTRSNLFG